MVIKPKTTDLLATWDETVESISDEKIEKMFEIKKCRRCGKQYNTRFTDGQMIDLIEYPERRKVDLCNRCSESIYKGLKPAERAEVETKEQITTEMFSDVKEGVTWPPNQKQPIF